MKVKILVSFEVETPTGKTEHLEEIASIERGELKLETLGLNLSEAKEILVKVQNALVEKQATDYVADKSKCRDCGIAYPQKGQHRLTFRTLFGKLHLQSPRFYQCECQSSPSISRPEPKIKPDKAKTRRSFSPLANFLKERSAPELVYLETKWAALMSYGLTSKLLADILPLDRAVSKATLSGQIKQVAERAEAELGEEQFSYIEGCPQEWYKLPQPNLPLVVGIDGGYVHARNDKSKAQSEIPELEVTEPCLSVEEAVATAELSASAESLKIEKGKKLEKDKEEAGNWFEMIVGKSMPMFEDGKGKGKNKEKIKCFGFVNCYDEKPKRRLFEVLKGQGMQQNQKIIFVSDGGDTVRNLQLYLSPEAEHLLDWFHVAMRLTVMKQMAKGFPILAPGEAKKRWEEWDEAKEELEVSRPNRTQLEKELESTKWYLWHGNVFDALVSIKDLEFQLDGYGESDAGSKKLLKKVSEFRGYIEANRNFIVNYGERYRHGETISSAFVESTVNQVISRRFVKKQQMRWKKSGAHLLMQVRTKVLNNELHQTFQRWYPAMQGVLDETEALEEMVA